MAKTRRQKTLADYAVLAITPALIMLLVGSLVFFLLEATYAGQWAGRLRWILFWFVFASVLVARLAILEGAAHASLYGLFLAAATSLVVFRYVDFVVVALGLLGVVWWCANKLTWDCTLIDDSEDASGEGLLQAAGLDPEIPPEANDHPTDAIDESDSSLPSSDLYSKRKNAKPHSPGLWVVYFSLAALPLFGVGQLLIPATETDRRRYALMLLVVYVGAALGLLLTTSFLGLRRYLRQRRIKMPTRIVGGWLGTGTVLILIVMAWSVLLPRPQADYSATALLDKLASQQQQASEYDALGGEAADGEGRRSGKDNDESDSDSVASDQQQAGKEGSKKQQDTRNNDRSNSNKGSTGKSSNEDGKKQQGKQQDQAGKQTSQQSDDNQSFNDNAQRDSKTPSRLTAWLARIGKWLIYLVIGLAVIWFLIRHHQQLLQSLKQIWRQLMSLFSNSRKDQHANDAEEDPQSSTRRSRPFAAFKNPFRTGTAGRMEPTELVILTFDALQAWAREQRLERPPEQTPLEFGNSLAKHYPEMSSAIVHACRVYVHVAYSDQMPSTKAVLKLETLWEQLSATERTNSRDFINVRVS